MHGLLGFLGFLRDPEFERKRAFLRGLPLFHGVTDREVGKLFSALYRRTYEKGETLFAEGDIGRALFILETGSIDLLKKTSSGEAQKIATLGPGEYFGEMALLEERPRLATAIAAEPTSVYMLYKAKLEGLYLQTPRLALAIIHHLAQVLSARLRAATEQMVAAHK